jgi:hypothetical protein
MVLALAVTATAGCGGDEAAAGTPRAGTTLGFVNGG